jgi:hypothetical protein
MADNIGKVVPSMRLNASLAAVTGLGEETDQVFADWLESVTPAAGAVRFGASTAADGARIAWRVEGDGEAMVPNLGGWLQDFGLSEPEGKRFEKATQALQPKRIGGVLEYMDGLDAGWYLPVNANAYDALLLEKRNPDVDKLAAWCEKHGADRCSRYLRFVARTQSEIWIPVPGAGEKAIMAALGAGELESRVPAAARAALIAAAGSGIDVVAGIRDIGVTSVGIHVRRPSTAQMLALARTVAKRDERRLAAFEGALGVNGAAGAEYRVYSNRTELLLHYDVA